MNNKITKIVLTGGPCAGKTTALSKIIERFSDLGYLVLALPESATLFSLAGVNFLTGDKKYFYTMEKSLLSFQIRMEEHFEEIAAESGKPAIVICDRGLMDVSAYVQPETWQALLDELNLSEVQARDKRYDAVLHLVTAAKGAERFYTVANNAARSENIEQAAALDNRLIRAWTGHPHLRVIDNSTDFESKINRTLAEIAAILGVPEPVETERKYRVELTADIPDAVENEIFQTYLLSDNGEETRLRKRGQNGHYVYFLTAKRTLEGNSRIETERQITPSEYLSLLAQADPDRVTIHKRRKCFVWQNQYFEIDSFINPALPFSLLEIEDVKNHEEINFPPFIRVLEDVTDNKEFYNNNLAKLNSTMEKKFYIVDTANY
jgi:CYTH domain-containing protein/thymidylate kinase